MKKRNTIYRLNKVDYAIFIIFSIAAAAMLYLFYQDLNSFTIKQSEEPVAKIYFKKNTAQRKFINNDIWEVLTKSSDIYDGDRIRTSKNSEAYTEFTDSGIQIQLREKSMVQIFKNKKERSVDFIGGEIFVATTRPDEKLVIHSGKNEISIGQASEVKLVLPEVSEAVAAGVEEAVDSTVVVEVVSGQVEIIEQPVSKTEKRENREVSEPMVVSAGETVTLVPEVPSEPASVPVEEVAVAEPEPVVDETVAEELVIEEPEAIQEVAAEPVLETASVPAPKTESIKKEQPAPVQAPVQPVVETVIPPQPVKAGITKTVKTKTASFKYNEWDPVNHKYEYAYGFQLSEGIEKNTVIPAGAVIEVTFTGVVDHDLRKFALQISTGEKEWKRAHAFKDVILNNGEGIKQGVPFEEKNIYLIENTIINTNDSWCGISYGPEVLDAPVNISDFAVAVKVVSTTGALETKTIQAGYTKTLQYPSFTFGKDKWGDGKNDFDYRMILDTNEIFTEAYSIPKGTKIKMTVTGTSDTSIQWMNPEFIYLKKMNDVDTEWVHTLLRKGNEDYYGLRFSDNIILKNKSFKLVKTYTINQDFENTRNGIFFLTPSKENVKESPTFTDMQITIEVLE